VVIVAKLWITLWSQFDILLAAVWYNASCENCF